MKDDLTASDIRKMQEEIEYRKGTVRPELLEHVKTARAHGDLSENFEYHAAKKEKNRNESRIRYLEKMIKTANVIDDSSADDEIGLNNTVKVEFLDDHSTHDFKIVTTVRVDTLKGYISIDSPIGKAILGKKAGDVVTVHVNGEVEYDLKVISIDKTTDDKNDAINAF